MLYVIGFLSDNGGAERFALGLATHLPRDRFGESDWHGLLDGYRQFSGEQPGYQRGAVDGCTGIE